MTHIKNIYISLVVIWINGALCGCYNGNLEKESHTQWNPKRLFKPNTEVWWRNCV